MATRKISVEIVGDSSSLERAFARSSRSAQRFNVGIGTIAKSALVFGLVQRGMDALSSAIGAGVSEWQQQATVAAQTNAVLRSTGGIANVAKGHVDALANSIARYSGLDDEAVKSSENLLLTFKNVRNEVGKGGAVFDRATKAAVDLSRAGFGALDSTSKQLGKALNDPVKGMTALGRAGVTFTQSQKDTIKALVENNRLLDAQKLILREVESQVGGSARAFGQTLPGQLARARESIRNVFGDLVGLTAPVLTKVLGSVNDFIDKLGAARTVRAKINVVFDTGRQLAAQAVKVAAEVFDRVSEALAAIDWRRVGRQVGDGLSRALSRIAAVVRQVDWGQVGGAIVRGISDFLKGVDWVALFKAVVKLQVAALKALANLLYGAGKELGSQLIRGIGDALTSLGNALRKKVLQLAIKIIEPLDFTVLGRHLVPGLHGIVKRLEGELDDLAAHSEGTARRIKSAMGKVEGAVRQRDVGPATRSDQAAEIGAAVKKVATTEKAAAEAAAKARKASAAKAAAAAVVAEKAAQKMRDAFATLIDSLDLKLDRARVTANMADDLKVLRDTERAIKAQIKAEGNTLELQRQLFEKRQEIADVQRQQRNQRQFKALDLTETGEPPIPGVRALRKQLAKVGDAVKGTFLDTGKTKSLLQSIRKVLSGQLGALGRDVRQKIQEILRDLNQQLSGAGKKGPLTKTTLINSKKVLAGLGLSPDQIRELRGRLSSFNTAGLAPGGAFRTPATAGGFAGAPIIVESNTTINLDGHKIATAVTRNQQKTKRRNPQQKRGPHRR